MAVILTPLDEPSIGLDLKDDYLVWDNPQEVVIQRRSNEYLYYVPTAVLIGAQGSNAQNALYNRITEKAVSDGAYLEHFGTWKVPALSLIGLDGSTQTTDTGSVVLTPHDTYFPKPGDYIIDGIQDIIWTVLDVNTPRHNDPWDLKCNSLQFNIPYTNTIDYYSVLATVDDYGGRVINKELVYSGLTTAIQPIKSGDELQANSRTYHNTQFNIWLEEDIDARIGDLIEDDENNWYRIESVENRERIDEYTLLIVKKVINEEELAS